jgi:hypothetical protein
MGTPGVCATGVGHTCNSTPTLLAGASGALGTAREKGARYLLPVPRLPSQTPCLALPCLALLHSKHTSGRGTGQDVLLVSGRLSFWS